MSKILVHCKMDVKANLISGRLVERTTGIEIDPQSEVWGAIAPHLIPPHGDDKRVILDHTGPGWMDDTNTAWAEYPLPGLDEPSVDGLRRALAKREAQVAEKVAAAAAKENMSTVKLAVQALAALVSHISQIDAGDASCPALATFVEIAGDLAEFASVLHKNQPAKRDALQALAEEALDNCK